MQSVLKWSIWEIFFPFSFNFVLCIDAEWMEKKNLQQQTKKKSKVKAKDFLPIYTQASAQNENGMKELLWWQHNLEMENECNLSYQSTLFEMFHSILMNIYSPQCKWIFVCLFVTSISCHMDIVQHIIIIIHSAGKVLN